MGEKKRRVETRVPRVSRPKMQMGPALLPTPLSPARGRFVPSIWSGRTFPSAFFAAHLATGV